MDKAFVYGKSVGGDNFTDRVKETRRLKLDFENGMNVILISPRRMGKTSLVKKVIAEMDRPDIKIVYMDIYDCRSEYDFYNRLATSLMKQTASRVEQVMENVKRFLVRVSPTFSFKPEPTSDFSMSLGITPKEYQPEEILNLPEVIAKEKDTHIVVCIDEFQQIGEMPDSLTIQKRLRGVWQHQTQVSYCLFGSKKHLMTQLFQDKRMPFYQFGEMIYLDKIPTSEWVPFIVERFAKQGKQISEQLAERICLTVDNQSSYVQQLAWNVLAETVEVASESDFINGVDAFIDQCSGLFVQQTQGLTTYQINFLKALCSDIHSDFGSKKVTSRFALGTKSNVDRIKKALIERELIEERSDGIYISDVVFRQWFEREMM
ncbi:MAG: ATP-binding protein [Prevotella sp.]|nr:ATP-binding protein [Prevotella sp.]